MNEDPNGGDMDMAGAEAPAASAAAMSETADLRRTVHQQGVALAETQKALRTMQDRDRRQHAEALLTRGVRDGKVTPKLAGTAQAPGWARAFAFRDPAGFKQWLEAAPRLVEFTERGTSDEAPATDAAATAKQIDQLALAEMEKDKSLSYSDATKKVVGGNRALADRYDKQMIGDRDGAGSPRRL